MRRTKTLQKAEIFSDLDSRAIDGVLESMAFVSCSLGEVVVTQGSVADALFVIVRGEFGVFRSLDGSPTSEVDSEEIEDGSMENKGRKIKVLRALDIFGENALLSSKTLRNATVVTETESSQLLKLSRSAFQALISSGHLGPEVLEKVKRLSERRHQSNMNLGLEFGA